MEERMEEAKRELQRVDHLIYVSLKYTRTVDVLKNVVTRLMSTFDVIILLLLERVEEKNPMFEIPDAPILRVKELKENYPEDKLLAEMGDFFVFLRKVEKNDDYSSEQEFRRHVAMIMDIDGEEVRICIDSVTEYYKKAKEYFDYVIKEYF